VSTVILNVGDQHLQLHPERAVTWLEQRTVIVADTHFGKSALLGRHGLAVPAGTDASDRDRLTVLVRGSQARRLIILGDFLHGPLEAASDEAQGLESWLSALQPLKVVVVAGNHDRHVLQRWSAPVDWHENDLDEPPLRFVHDNDPLSRATRKTAFVLSGHIHPAVRVGAPTKRQVRVPVFWQHAGGLVLPSFGAFTGGHVIGPRAGDRLFAVAPDAVVPLGLY
jgi:uncharacterized protein